MLKKKKITEVLFVLVIHNMLMQNLFILERKGRQKGQDTPAARTGGWDAIGSHQGLGPSLWLTIAVFQRFSAAHKGPLAHFTALQQLPASPHLNPGRCDLSVASFLLGSTTQSPASASGLA